MKIDKICIGLAALALAGSPAHAGKWSPANSTTTFRGQVTLKLGTYPAFLCMMNITMNIDADGKGSIANMAFDPGSICGASSFFFSTSPLSTWNYNASINGIDFSGPFGFRCYGALNVQMSPIWGLTFSNATLSGNYGNCVFNGTVSSMPMVTYTIL